MWQPIKRAVHRALGAMGYTLVRNPVLRHSEERGAGDRRMVGLSQTTVFDFGDKARSELPMADDRFVEIDAMLAKVTPWSGHVPDGYATDFLGILRDENFLWTNTGPFTPGGGFDGSTSKTKLGDGSGRLVSFHRKVSRRPRA